MKNWKKFALTSASVVALAATLAACSSLTGEKKSSAKSEDGKTVIKMYQIGDKPDNLDKLLENANKIIEKKTGVKLDIQYIGWGEYGDKMNVMVQSGENFDIAFAQNYVINAQKGAYADLTDLYKKEGKELYKSLDPAYIKGNTVNGKLYAVPVNANITSAQHFAFNGPLLEKYGIDVSNVNSYEDLEAALKTIKEKAPETTPVAINKDFVPSENFDYPVTNELPFVIDLKGDATKVVNRYEVPRFVEHLKTLHKYYQAGYIPQDVATSDTSYDLQTDTWFVREETVGPADYGNSLLSRVANRNITIRPFIDFYKKNQTAQVANFIISNTSKNKEKAMEVLNVLNTDKELLNGWNTGNNWLLYLNENVTDEQVAESKKTLAEAKESPALGFNFNTEPVKSEITAVINTVKQYSAAINTGTVDPEVEIPKLMDKLKSEGAYDKVLKELQKQYDEFLASKK